MTAATAAPPVDLCPRTGVAVTVCSCDDCWLEAPFSAPHRSLCGRCTGTIQLGQPVVRRAGESYWWHQPCADAA